MIPPYHPRPERWPQLMTESISLRRSWFRYLRTLWKVMNRPLIPPTVLDHILTVTRCVVACTVLLCLWFGLPGWKFALCAGVALVWAYFALRGRGAAPAGERP